MDIYVYTFKGVKYKVLDERAPRLISDFKHCEDVGDWITIENRIKNGLIWGWLKKC